MAVLMVFTFLGAVRCEHVSDRTSVSLIAHPSDDVDTLTEHMFAFDSRRAYADLMSGTQAPTTDRPSDQQ